MHAPALSSLLQDLYSKITLEIAHGHLQVAKTPRQLPIHEASLSPDKQKGGSFAQSRSSPLFKSQFPREQQREVRRLRAEMVRFEQSLEEKNREAAQFQRSLQEEARKEENSRLRVQWQRHRQAALVRKQQRVLQRKHEELIAHSPRQLSSRVLYKELEHQKQVQQELQERQRAELLSVLSQQRRGLVNISRLGEHEQGYLRRVRQEKAERTRRIEEARAASKLLEEGERSLNYKSKSYLKVAAQAEEQRKAAEEALIEKKRSQEKLHQFLQRIRSQSELTHQQRPLRKTANTKQRSSPAHVARPNLTQLQIRELGDRFLRDSLLRIAEPHKRSIVTEPNPPQQQQKTPDYLEQLRRQRSTQNSSRSFSMLHGSKLERILSSPLPQEDKVEKLKKLAHRLEAGPSSSSAEEELMKIHAKMKILQAALRARE